MGYPAPNFMPVSISSGVATPTYRNSIQTSTIIEVDLNSRLLDSQRTLSCASWCTQCPTVTWCEPWEKSTSLGYLLYVSAVQWATVYIKELRWLSYLSHIDELLLPYKELRVGLPQSPACPENKQTIRAPWQQATPTLQTMGTFFMAFEKSMRLLKLSSLNSSVLTTWLRN